MYIYILDCDQSCCLYFWRSRSLLLMECFWYPHPSKNGPWYARAQWTAIARIYAKGFSSAAVSALSHWKAVGVRLKPNSNLRKRIWQRPCCIRKDCVWLKALHIVHASCYKQQDSYCSFIRRGSSLNPTPQRHMSHPFCWWQMTMLTPVKYLDCLWLQ